MRTTRAAHTATLLPDGRVLILGGLGAGAGSAELYDPASRTFVAAASPQTRRWSQTATRLSDDRILIAGGYNGAYLASTEIYDWKTETFAAGPAMLQARQGHLAVRLNDDRVLIIGGQGAGGVFLASAEIYDPVTNAFTATGSMAVARESHVAALLPDGTVLVAGGHHRTTALQLEASAERFDPTRGVFIPAGAMSHRRHKHAGVALPDGRVLVTGGADERDDRGMFGDAELFDARTGAFAPTASMQRARYKHQETMIALRDGLVLIAGGAAEAEVFDPERGGGTFALVPTSPPLAGNFSAVVELGDGSVLVTGGYGNGTGPRASAWIYLPRP